MPTYRVRYKVGHAPPDADDGETLDIEAAMYVTSGNFIDFYDGAQMGAAGTQFAQGTIVYRVQIDIVADIRIAS